MAPSITVMDATAAMIKRMMMKPKSLSLHSLRIHGTGIFTYIYHKNQPNVGINIYICRYTIHGSYEICNRKANEQSQFIMKSLLGYLLVPGFSSAKDSQIIVAGSLTPSFAATGFYMGECHDPNIVGPKQNSMVFPTLKDSDHLWV